MMTSIRLGTIAGLALSFAVVAHAAPPLSGAIFTTDKNGTIVNGNTTYLGKCGDGGVYLNGGPADPATPAPAASLPDGDYYFQVTDPSGKVLLSTDPVRNRCITVAGGVVIGNCPTGSHNSYVDQDRGSVGARTVELCAPTVPFLDTPNDGGVYKVWVTPTGDGTLAAGGFFGDVTKVDNDCGGGVPGCFHGFLASRSKTDIFKAKDAPTFCIRAQKQLVDPATGTSPGAGWKILVTDSTGVTNNFTTDAQGSTGDQICGLTTGSYMVAEENQDGYTQIGVELNGQPIDSSSVLVTLGTGKVTGDQTVLFINQFVGTPGT